MHLMPQTPSLKFSPNTCHITVAVAVAVAVAVTTCAITPHHVAPAALPGAQSHFPSYLPHGSATAHLTKLSAPTASPLLSSAATSTFSGLSIPGFANMCATASTVFSSVYAGLQLSFRRSRQISPV
jgi:hypothetical protein